MNNASRPSLNRNHTHRSAPAAPLFFNSAYDTQCAYPRPGFSFVSNLCRLPERVHHLDRLGILAAFGEPTTITAALTYFRRPSGDSHRSINRAFRWAVEANATRRAMRWRTERVSARFSQAARTHSTANEKSLCPHFSHSRFTSHRNSIGQSTFSWPRQPMFVPIVKRMHETLAIINECQVGDFSILAIRPL